VRQQRVQRASDQLGIFRQRRREFRTRGTAHRLLGRLPQQSRRPARHFDKERMLL
jgi:hypothetical protein